MKIHLITVGEPKLAYAKVGWEEYYDRLKHYHQLRVSHIADKHSDAEHILGATGSAYKVALVIEGQQFTSPELASFLDKQAQTGREAAFIIGGPDGLPPKVIQASDVQLSLSRLTFPHDLAMVVLLETLYRASTILHGHPYHK